VKPRVYLETSVVSYLVGRLSRDVVVLANQELTREWWENRRAEYDLFISEVVIGAAATQSWHDTAWRFVRPSHCRPSPTRQSVLRPCFSKRPPNAETDALHIAVAAVHGTDYLLLWNCSHIANATIRRAIDRQCRASGYEPPVICTP
jgi:hypothetical protein